jgi:hypothetical protein
MKMPPHHPHLTTIFEQLYKTMAWGGYEVARIDLAVTPSVATVQAFEGGQFTLQKSSRVHVSSSKFTA